MKTIYKYRALAAGVLALGALAYAFWPKEEAATSKAPPPEKAALSVKLVRPVVQVWNSAVSATGEFAPWQEAVIAAETGSLRIAGIFADVGTHVHRGQLLVTLDDRSIRADCAKHAALIAQARAALKQAQADAQRAQQVKNTGSLSEQAVAQYMAIEQTNLANLASAEADLENDHIRLAQTRVLAVDDGVITRRSALLGNVIPVGAELFRMIRQNRIEWRAEISSSELSLVAPGQSVIVHVNGADVAGKVRMISPALSSDTRLAIAYVDLAKDKLVQAGTYASGTITTGHSPAVTLPASAVVTRDGQHYVFVVAAHDTKVRQQSVVTGRWQDGSVEIMRGLIGAETVVERGGIFLGDGDAIVLSAAVARSTSKVQ